jgi:hypothetical protein
MVVAVTQVGEATYDMLEYTNLDMFSRRGGEMLVRDRRRGRGRDEDVGRGCIESWWELKKFVLPNSTV